MIDQFPIASLVIIGLFFPFYLYLCCYLIALGFKAGTNLADRVDERDRYMRFSKDLEEAKKVLEQMTK